MSKGKRKFGINLEHGNPFSHKFIKIIITFVLIDFSWLFFRADGFIIGIRMLKEMIRRFNPWILVDGSLFQIGLDRKNFQIMILSIMCLLVADGFKYKGMVLRKKILEQDWWFRWLVYISSVMVILIFGIWGTGYAATNFIYFKF